MIGATFCSGIGAPEVAAPWVDWQLASEIDAFPRAVLQTRFDYRDAAQRPVGPALWGDFTALRPRHMRRLGIPFPDLIVAGTPCQAFSVAGLRDGLADARGNLTLQFVRRTHAIVNARPDGRLAVLWENVPGVLSSADNAFGAFLGGMVGGMDALPPPDGGSWPGEGMVQGPRARAAWAVLDAQYFDVAQRRARVFALFDFGNCLDPAAVLFDADRLRGNPPPRDGTGEGLAPDAASGAFAGRGETGGVEAPRDDTVIARPAVANPLTARMHKGVNTTMDEGQTMVAHALRGEGFDASEDGTGRGTPLVPVRAAQAVAFDCKGSEVQFADDGSHPPLRAMGHVTSHQNSGGHAAVAFDTTQITSAQNGSNPQPGDPSHPLASGAHPPALALSDLSTWTVRRLTPRECERLQGFPDDHTLITRNRRRAIKAASIADELAYLRRTYPDLTEAEAYRLAADGPRYKALGNSMAVPVIRWILNRVRLSAAQHPAPKHGVPA